MVADSKIAGEYFNAAACLSSLTDIKRLKKGVTINKHCIPEGVLRKSTIKNKYDY